MYVEHFGATSFLPFGFLLEFYILLNFFIFHTVNCYTYMYVCVYIYTRV